MTIRRFRGDRTRPPVGDPLPQKRAGKLVMRFFGSCALFVAALASLMAGGSLAVSGVAPAGASLPDITVNCPIDNLQDAINAAPIGSTLLVSGTCTGNFYIVQDVTLTGPATLDGGGVGVVLNVISGTAVLNNLTIEHGIGISGLGGGIWNHSQLTLNNSTVTDNTANEIGGVFNMGQLTLNNSMVTHNTANLVNAGGIFNCGANPGLQAFNLCTGPPGSLTLNNSTVSNNVGGSSGEGGGIVNDVQAAMTLNGSTVSGNTSGGGGGGIVNDGTATLSGSTVSGNAGSDSPYFGFGHNGGGIENLSTGTLTLKGSTVSVNTTGINGNGGGIENDGTVTLNSSTVSGNGTATNGNGGGIDNQGTATLILSNVLDNTVGNFGNGGGIENDGTVTLNSSTVSGNATTGSNFGNGGGIWNQGTANLNSSTVSLNTAYSGGGIWNQGTANLNWSTVSNNASNGGAQFFGAGGGVDTTATSTTTINNSIIEANSAQFVGGGIFAGGPMHINNSVVTGNTAVSTAGGMLVWNGPTTVANSAFSNNHDGGQFGGDTLPGVLVAQSNFFGLGNYPTFKTTHSTYS